MGTTKGDIIMEAITLTLGEDAGKGIKFTKNMATKQQGELFAADVRKFVEYLNARYSGNPYFSPSRMLEYNLQKITAEAEKARDEATKEIDPELGKLATYAKRAEQAGLVKQAALSYDDGEWGLRVYDHDEKSLHVSSDGSTFEVDGLTTMDIGLAYSALSGMVKNSVMAKPTADEMFEGLSYIIADIKIYEPFSDDATIQTFYSRPFNSEKAAQSVLDQLKADKSGLRAWVKENCGIGFDFDEVSHISVKRCPSK